MDLSCFHFLMYFLKYAKIPSPTTETIIIETKDIGDNKSESSTKKMMFEEILNATSSCSKAPVVGNL